MYSIMLYHLWKNNKRSNPVIAGRSFFLQLQLMLLQVAYLMTLTLWVEPSL